MIVEPCTSAPPSMRAPTSLSKELRTSATAIESAPPVPKLPPRLPTPATLRMLPRSTACTVTGADRSHDPPARPPPHTSAPLRIVARTTLWMSLIVSAAATVMFTLNELTAAVMVTATATVVASMAGTRTAVPASADTVTPAAPVTVAPSMRASTVSSSVFWVRAPAPLRPMPAPLELTVMLMLTATTVALTGTTELASTITWPPATTTVVAPSIEARMLSRTVLWAMATVSVRARASPLPLPIDPPRLAAPTPALASPSLPADTTMSPLAVSRAPPVTLASTSLAMVLTDTDAVIEPLIVAPPDELIEMPAATATTVDVILALARAVTSIEPAVAVTVAASMWANSSSAIVFPAPAPAPDTATAVPLPETVTPTVTVVLETVMSPDVWDRTLTDVPTTRVVAPMIAASRSRSILLSAAAKASAIEPP